MTDDTAPSNGASDSSRTEHEHDSQAETDASGDPTRKELAGENEQLRERVDELEAALAKVQATLANESANTPADSPAAADVTVDDPEGATTADPELATSGGQPTKVIGRLSDDQGIGVLGEATATSTTTYGVEGIAQSSNSDAAGVRASASNGALGLDAEAEDNYAIAATATSDNAIYAETDGSFYNAVQGVNTSSTGSAWGVRGDTKSEDSNAYGVRGFANNSSGSPKGVGGQTYSSGDGAAGVEGVAAANSGVTYGVKGETDSSDGYGLYTPDDASVEGSMSVGNTGVSAYLDTAQTVDSDTATTVAFDSTAADHFGGMDTSTGVYTIQEDGDYHVSILIDWSTFFGSGVEIRYQLATNGDLSGQGFDVDTTTAGSSQRVMGSFSRTIFDLTSGDTIEVIVRQDSGSQKDIYGARQDTYMTIHKVG